MKNALSTLKAKKNSKKGFTLMEMLIVVAIIAILVAIAIPTFNSSLNKAKQAADDANIRAAYAQYQIDAMLDASDTATKVDAASPAEMQAAFKKIGVQELKIYSGVNIPADGSRWTGAEKDGTAIVAAPAGGNG